MSESAMKDLLDRRTFLRDAGALTVSASLLASGAAVTMAPDPLRGPRISAVLFDGRYSSGREFAKALVREGAAAFDVGPDVAMVWYGSLRNHLASFGGSVAGLTTQSDFFVSRCFGRELGRSAKYEGAHDSRGCREIMHRLRGTEDVSEIGDALRRAEYNWSEALAFALVRAKAQKPLAQWRRSEARTLPIGDHPGFLTSWLLTS